MKLSVIDYKWAFDKARGQDPKPNKNKGKGRDRDRDRDKENIAELFRNVQRCNTSRKLCYTY